MKKLISRNIWILLFLILLELVVYYLTHSIYFSGNVELFRTVINYVSLGIILAAGIYLFRYNFLFPKNNPSEKKFLPVMFMIISLAPILYSLLLFYILFATRNGIGF